jgi:DNA polymerase III sliding clamp (beta) subunit (PCNA family)
MTTVAAPPQTATLATKTLQAALATVAPAVAGRMAPPICSTFYVEATYGDDGTEPSLFVAATNLEMGIRRVCRLATLEAEFKACVPADRFKNFVDGLVGPVVTLELSGNELVVSAHRAKARLKTMGAADFPAFPTAGTPILSCAGKRLLLADRLVSAFAAKDEKRPVLHGVNLTSGEGGVRVQACDGNIAAVWTGFADPTVEQHEACDVVVSVDLFGHLARIAGAAGDEKVHLFTSRKDRPSHLFLMDAREDESTDVAVRLMEGQYPDIKRVIPTETEAGVGLTVNPKTLAGSLKRVVPFGVRHDTGTTVSLTADLEYGSLGIVCRDAELGKAEDAIDAAVQHSDGQTYHHASGNLQKAMDAIGSAGPDADAVIWQGSPMSPCKIVSPALPGYVSVVMPMSVKGDG